MINVNQKILWLADFDLDRGWLFGWLVGQMVGWLAGR
jgi:hypothetical protein